MRRISKRIRLRHGWRPLLRIGRGPAPHGQAKACPTKSTLTCHALPADVRRPARAPSRLLGTWSNCLQSADGASGNNLGRLLEDHWDTYPAQISAVTAEDVQRAAKSYLNLDTVRSVAVGDAVKIKPVLEKYGKVTVYDAAGKVM